MLIILGVDGEVFDSEILSHYLNKKWQSSELINDLPNHLNVFWGCPESQLVQYFEADVHHCYCQATLELVEVPWCNHLWD